MQLDYKMIISNYEFHLNWKEIIPVLIIIVLIFLYSMLSFYLE